jgi:hypothetical protein
VPDHKLEASFVVTVSRRFIGYDPQVQLPDQRTELALGDLVSGEERYVVPMLEVLPLVFITPPMLGQFRSKESTARYLAS